ncbi:MAG: DUF433 domain-containing protein [Chloroflexi bacterium]|nr:DUF433 domain-containing protein [Chloroflexota bacterium]
MTDPSPANVNESLIELDPYKPGRANAFVTGAGVAVWAIIAYWQGVQDLEQVAADYELTEDQMKAAFDYYHQNKAVIDARIEGNEAA